jgi:hypothetical protein
MRLPELPERLSEAIEVKGINRRRTEPNQTAQIRNWQLINSNTPAAIEVADQSLFGRAEFLLPD